MGKSLQLPSITSRLKEVIFSVYNTFNYEKQQLWRTILANCIIAVVAITNCNDKTVKIRIQADFSVSSELINKVYL